MEYAVNRIDLLAWAIGGISAPLGGSSAGVITYLEYSQHRLPKGRAVREALRSGVVATLVMLTITGLFGWWMGRS
jgi:hypothetical protein